MSEELKIGVVIPSYNERNDLVETLKTIFNQDSAFSEIIVVDDSVDGTDQLVKTTFGEQVKLIHRNSPQGRCSARNLGMQLSTADIVVILNADVHLPPHFCTSLKQQYASKNCDALGVDVLIENTNQPYSRYLFALHLSQKREAIGWTEGFSVRRSSFLKTKGFPDNYPVSILAGEDAEWFFDLQRTGAKICFDFDLIVTTVMPEDWQTIESQIRGRASLRTWHFVYDKALWYLLLRSIVKQIRRFIILITVVPFIWRVLWLWRHFNHSWQDILHYAKYELYVEWIRTSQEWLDLTAFIKLHNKNGWNIFDIFLKSPSQLVFNTSVN